MRVLVLGGTEEGRALSDQLVIMGHEVTTSFAGRTSAPLLPAGEVRSGGFGGAMGLAEFIRAGNYQRLVDATHPYSVQIATNAVHAAKTASVPLVRIVRPAWAEPNYAFWKHVSSSEEAAAMLPPAARVLLTIGHRGLDAFLARSDCDFLVRTIEEPEMPLPVHARPLLMRPPYFLGHETELFEREAITHLVTKNSGGAQTAAKLEAALQLRVVVLMIDRPARPEAIEVATVGGALAALHLERS